MGVFEQGGAGKCTESVTDAGQCRGHTQRGGGFIQPRLTLYRPITVQVLSNPRLDWSEKIALWGILGKV